MAKNVTDGASVDVLSLEESMKAIGYALKSNTPIHFIGPPGIGKSAIVEAAADGLKMKLETLLLSQCDPTDVGGFPVADGRGGLTRLPLGPIKRACEEGVILFLDELSCATPAVQGAALQLIYNRCAGDVRLHKDTRIIAASNPADQAAGGWNLALPLISRLTQIKMMPTLKEVQTYFYNLKPQNESLHMLAVDFAATLESAPDLLQMSPPPGTQEAGNAWGSPRSWERAITFCSEVLNDGQSDVGTIFTAGLAGNVGDSQALAYQNIRKLREDLPKVSDILKDPTKASLPKNLKVAIAALGVLGQVAVVDACAAWVYASRLEQDEIQMATFEIVGRIQMPKNKSDSKHYEAGITARNKMLKKLGQAVKMS